MRRIWPVLTFVWGALIVGGAVNIASNKYGTLFENARILFYTVLVLVFFGLASLLAYRDWRKKQAIGEFDLCKSASLLEPEDVGFKAARPGEAVLVGRPYFADIYVKRTAVPYSQRHSENHLEFTESDIKSALKRGESVLFIGSPTEGKTRTIFEIVKHMEDFLVLRPKRDHMPTDEAISITSDRKVVLILDDFDAFSTSTVNLAELYEKISKSASCCALISACRNGAEFECLVLAATPLQKIYESFVYRLVLQRPSDTEKGWLKLALNESSTRNFPTLGSICLREAFDVMRDRIQNISGAAQDCFHALHLLSGGGVDPLSHSRLKGVLEDVFERPTSGSALRDSLRELERYGLVLSSANADPVRVETAYVLGPETDSYYKGQQPVKGDFPKLACALLKRDDAIGLNQLAWNYYTRNDSSSAFATWTSVAEAFSSRCEVAFQIEVAKSILNAGWCLTQKQDDTKAMVYFDKVEKLFSASKEPEIREVVDITLTNKVALKSKIGDFSDVIRCCDEIEARIGFGKEFGARPMIAKALVNKAIALDELCRPNEALACYDDLDRRFGSDREPSVLEGLVQGLVNKGIMLVKMGLAREAINWYSNLETRLNSNTDPNVQVQVGRIMVNKGDALCGLYSFTDGMEIYESAYRYLATLDPSSEIRRVSARALMGKGVALGREGKTLEQRACYDEIESILNDDPGPESRSIVARALTNKAATFSGDTSLSIYSEIERRFGSDDDPTVLDEVIRAMKHEAAALMENDFASKAIEVYDNLFQRFFAERNPLLRTGAVEALILKAVAFGRNGNEVGKLKCLDEIGERFKLDEEPDIQYWVVEALLQKGRALRNQKLPLDSVACYELVDERFAKASDPRIQAVVAQALLSKGITLGTLGHTEAEIRCCDEVCLRYAKNAYAELRAKVAKSLLHKGDIFGEKGDQQQQLHYYDLAIERYGEDESPIVWKEVATICLNKSDALLVQRRFDEAAACCEFLDKRFGNLLDRELQELSLMALVNMGEALGGQEKWSSQFACYDKVDRRFVPELRLMAYEDIIPTLMKQAEELKNRDRLAEAAAIYGEVCNRFGKDSLPKLNYLVEKAKMEGGKMNFVK